jgi:hypothetical protein
MMKSARVMLVGAMAVGMAMSFTACGSHYGRPHHGGAPYGASAMGPAGHTSLEKGKQEVAALIDKTIQDPAKAKRVKDLAQDIMNEVTASTEQSRAGHQQLYTANARYDATPEEFTKILDDINNQRMQHAARILKLRFEMKDTLTEQEWKALTDALNGYRGQYHHGKGTSQGSAQGANSGY